MTRVVNVRFREAGKEYRFESGDMDLKIGDHVIVDSQKGKAFAYVTTPPHEMFGESRRPLKKVVRIANEEDEERQERNREREKRAYYVCKEKIAEQGLEMKLVAAEQAFTGKKMIFYFTADDRVDFRELVKELAGEFHTRIEMRQIGVRDETTMCGGIGICGRELCCCTFMTEFAPVSIKMAKAQNLSLNPGKISGTCGRLMCCLRNEAEAYEELNKTVPKMGEKVKTPEGTIGTVTSLDVLRQKVKVLIEIDENEKELKEFDASELEFKPRGRKGQPGGQGGSGAKQNGGKEKNTGAGESAESGRDHQDGRNHDERKGGAEGKDGKSGRGRNRGRRSRRGGRNRNNQNREGQNKDGQSRDNQNREGRDRDHHAGPKPDRQD